MAIKTLEEEKQLIIEAIKMVRPADERASREMEAKCEWQRDDENNN